MTPTLTMPLRIHRLHRALLVSFLLMGVGLLSLQAIRAQPLLTGISDPATTEGGDRLAFSRIQEAGARFVRLTVSWPSVAPAGSAGDEPTNPSDPGYTWAGVDAQVLAADEAGLVPLLQIYGAPRWAQRCHRHSQSGAPCNLDPKALADFATAAARRYGGSFRDLPRVRYWQVQNEPNLYFFFNPQFKQGKAVSPGLYRTILNRFSAAVKAVRGSNLVVTAGLAPIGRPHATIAPLRFARLLLCMQGRRHPRPAPSGCAGGVHFDIFSMHPYTTGGPTHRASAPDDVSLGDLPELRRLLSAADRAGHIKGAFGHTPLWVTEFSWDSKPPDPGGLPTGIHARWTSEALYRAWQAGVQAFFWFGLRDQDRGGAPFDQTVQSGLYFRGPTLADDRPKRALRAFRFPFVAFRSAKGVMFWGRTPTSESGEVRLLIRKGGRWTPLKSVRANPNGFFQGSVPTPYGRGLRGLVKARYRTGASVPFSLHPVKDFYQPPFG